MAYMFVAGGIALFAVGLWTVAPWTVVFPAAAAVGFGLVGVDIDGG